MCWTVEKRMLNSAGWFVSLLSFCHSLRGCWTESCPTCQRWVAPVTRCLNTSPARSWVSGTPPPLIQFLFLSFAQLKPEHLPHVRSRPPTCRQAEWGGNPVSHPERQTNESHQRSKETVSQLQPLQHVNASLRRQHRPRGRACQGLVPLWAAWNKLWLWLWFANHLSGLRGHAELSLFWGTVHFKPRLICSF